MRDREQLVNIFNQALALNPPRRQAFLDETCRDDPSLRAELDSLLAAHDQAPDFFDAMQAELPAQAFPPADRSVESMIGRTVGAYRILEHLGGGGMGLVYRAQHEQLERPAALKFLPPGLNADPEARARFMQEARAASALDHVHIGTIFDIGISDDGRLFLAMAYYDGQTLKAHIKQGSLPIDRVLDYATQVARGLRAAHKAGIVHRDIKPANLILTRGDAAFPNGQIKILDFGIAKMATQAELTRTGAMMGTLAYMSPEQARGEPVDHRTDLWSLGVVMYEMLTGERPFQGDYEHAMLYAILHQPIPSVSEAKPDIPEPLDQIIGRLLVREPDQRYDSATALLDDLKQLARDATSSKPEVVMSDSSAAFRTPDTQLRSEGEHLLATISVSHLAGYLDLMEHLDLADTGRFMNRVRAAAEELAHLYGGILHTFAEGEIVLLFGVPTPHENAPIHAVWATRELHNRIQALHAEVESVVGPNFGLLSGIDTGRVLARRQEPDRYQVTGTPMQVSARLADMSEPGQILVSPSMHRWIEPYVESEQSEPLRMRGRRESIIPYRITDLKTHPDSLLQTDASHLSVFTGRDAELNTLRRSLDQIFYNEGRFVSIMGEAGLGKSRLLYEFEQNLPAGDVNVIRSRCRSHGGTTPYLSWIEVLKQLLGEAARQNEVEQIADRIRQMDTSLVDYIPFYLRLLSIESDTYRMPKILEGENFRPAMIDALISLLTMQAVHSPTVIILEDWHWSDEASREILTSLIELLPAYALMVVVTYRPSYVPDWGYPDHHVPIRLRPMRPASSLTIISSTWNVEQIPKQLVTVLHERAGGNPFFLEEICKTLVEDGTVNIEDDRVQVMHSLDQLTLPETIQAVLQARMHRLPSSVRSVLQLASVVGREFSWNLLQHIRPDDTDLTASLEQLKAAGLTQQIRVVPAPAYRFKHALIQDAAYDSLRHHQRKVLHREVGDAISTLYADRLRDHLELLVHHFMEAEAWEQVIVYGNMAAERAWEMQHNLTMSDLLERLTLSLEKAQSMLSDTPGKAPRQALINVLLSLERLCDGRFDTERQEELLDALFKLVDPAEDPALHAEINIRLGELFTLQTRFDEAEPPLKEALHLHRENKDLAGERKALRALGFLYWNQDRVEEASTVIDQVLTLSRQQGDMEILMSDMVSLGSILRARGQTEQALQILNEVVSTDYPMHPMHYSQAYFIMAQALHDMGKNEEALTYLFRHIKQQPFIMYAGVHTSIATIYFEQGQYQESLYHYNEALTLVKHRPHYKRGLGIALNGIGSVLLSMGRPGEALPHFKEVMDLLERWGGPLELKLNTQRMIATACEQTRNWAGAQVAWQQVLTYAEQRGNHAAVLEALEGKAQSARNQGRNPDIVITLFEDTLKKAGTLEHVEKQGDLLNTLGILTWEKQDYAAALAYYEQALELYENRNDLVHAGLIRNSIGVTLHHMGRLDEAIDELNKAIAVHRRSSQRQLEAHALAALGRIYLDQEDHDSARQAFGDSLQIRWDLNDRRGEGWMLYYLGRIHAEQGETEQAEEYRAQAESIATECNDQNLLQVLR